jgi:hypothetical protein
MWKTVVRVLWVAIVLAFVVEIARFDSKRALHDAAREYRDAIAERHPDPARIAAAEQRLRDAARGIESPATPANGTLTPGAEGK